jgi:hypothetical protein
VVLSKVPQETILKLIQSILEARNNLNKNSSSSLTIEALLSNLRSA